MADDWQPGDLALCVNTDDAPTTDIYGCNVIGTAGRRFRRGAIYTVVSVATQLCYDFRSAPALFLALKGDKPGMLAGAWRFRKIKPHERDAEDEETIRLLNGVSQPKEIV